MGRRAYIPRTLKDRPFTLEEARAAGLTHRQLQGRTWRRIGSGLYRLARAREETWQVLDGWHRRLPDAVFSGLTAAWLHRLHVDPCRPVEVSVPAKSGVRSRPTLTVRRREIAKVEITNIRGLPATTLQKTFRDLRGRLPAGELLVLADAALKLGLGRFDDLAEPAESPMETRLRWLLLHARLPRPEVQTELRDSDGTFLARADLYYPQAKLVIEYDGANHRERLIEDDRRQNALLNAGFRLLRFTAGDVLQRPETVIALVRKMLPDSRTPQ